MKIKKQNTIKTSQTSLTINSKNKYLLETLKAENVKFTVSDKKNLLTIPLDQNNGLKKDVVFITESFNPKTATMEKSEQTFNIELKSIELLEKFIANLEVDTTAQISNNLNAEQSKITAFLYSADFKSIENLTILADFEKMFNTFKNSHELVKSKYNNFEKASQSDAGIKAALTRTINNLIKKNTKITLFSKLMEVLKTGEKTENLTDNQVIDNCKKDLIEKVVTKELFNVIYEPTTEPATEPKADNKK